MPRYDFKCEAGHKYEKQEPFGSPAEQPCQKCGRPARRMPSAPPLVFKTGGYYKSSGRDFSAERGDTGSGSSSPPSSKSSSKPSSKSSPKAESKKSESKQAPAKAAD